MTTKTTKRAGGRRVTRRDIPTALSVRACRKALTVFATRYAMAYGQAQWSNGYRAGGQDSKQMCQREMDWFQTADREFAKFELAISAYTMAVRSAR